MTNVLELSRNFCYNNNREVKARMSRRTREAMASELKLPQHYVELDEQEMTYVDGGSFFHSTKEYSGAAGWVRVAWYVGLSVVSVMSAVAAVAMVAAPTIVTQIVGAMAFLESLVGFAFGFTCFIGALAGMIMKGSFTEHTFFGVLSFAA